MPDERRRVLRHTYSHAIAKIDMSMYTGMNMMTHR